MKTKLTLALLAASMLLFTGCSQPKTEPQELKFTTVIECINDAKLNDRNMTIIGNSARDMSVEDFVKWYNDNYAQ